LAARRAIVADTEKWTPVVRGLNLKARSAFHPLGAWNSGTNGITLCHHTIRAFQRHTPSSFQPKAEMEPTGRRERGPMTGSRTLREPGAKIAQLESANATSAYSPIIA
jgi:hypothetical protein